MQENPRMCAASSPVLALVPRRVVSRTAFAFRFFGSRKFAVADSLHLYLRSDRNRACRVLVHLPQLPKHSLRPRFVRENILFGNAANPHY